MKYMMMNSRREEAETGGPIRENVFDERRLRNLPFI